jgi:hypothetical protein
VTFHSVSTTNIGAAPGHNPRGLLDIRSPLAAPVILKECFVPLNNWPLLYFDPNNNTVPLTLDAEETVIQINPATATVFLGLSYLGVRLTSCTVSLARDSASFFSCYSNSGGTYTDITGLRIRNDNIALARPLKLIDNARYNTLYWEGISSDALAILNVSAFVDASLAGDILDCRFTSLTLANAQMTLANLRVANVVGDLFNVTAVTLRGICLLLPFPLNFIGDGRPFLASPAGGPRLFNHNLLPALYPLNYRGFCGSVIGGSSYGLSRLICLGILSDSIIRSHLC